VRPGGIDRSTLGHPGKFSYCLAEDEEDMTWEPLSVFRGVPNDGTSAVTVMAALAPRQIMNEWTTDPKEILETFAAEMRANQRHYSIYGGNYAIIIPKQLREHIQNAGWSKRDIADFLFERARIKRKECGDRARPAGEGASGAGVAGSSAGDRRGRTRRRFRRGDPAMDGLENEGGDGAARRLCRLRARLISW
jgi:hypothetical protein